MWKIWSFISDIGIRPEYDFKVRKRIRVTNQLAFIAVFGFLIGGTNNLIIGNSHLGILSFLFILPCISIFLLNRINFHILATSTILIALNFALFYFSSYGGILSGEYLYYLPMILVIAYIIDYREKALLIFHYTFALTLLIINVVTKFSLFSSNTITEEDQMSMFVVNILTNAGLILYLVYVTITNNIKEAKLAMKRTEERKKADVFSKNAMIEKDLLLTEIKNALHEKEVLLAEIHHRVKNNMAIISSLFNLQLGTTINEEARTILTDSKNRVKSMSLIHDSLYKSKNLSIIDFNVYTKELINEIKSSYPKISNNIEVNANISNVTLDVNNAIPCGLILNELFTNCYKHAFVGRDKGKIDVSISSKDQLIKFRVKDDGVGLMEGYDKKESLGIIVIHSLCDQLEAKYKFSNDNGTLFEMEFLNKST